MVHHLFQPVEAVPFADTHVSQRQHIANLLANEDNSHTVLCGSYRAWSPLVLGRHVFLSSGDDGV